jgi:hypothetical protein
MTMHTTMGEVVQDTVPCDVLDEWQELTGEMNRVAAACPEFHWAVFWPAHDATPELIGSAREGRNVDLSQSVRVFVGANVDQFAADESNRYVWGSAYTSNHRHLILFQLNTDR